MPFFGKDTAVTEVSLAETGSLLGRLRNRLDIAASAVVDTAQDGPPTVRHGDSDAPGFRATAPAPRARSWLPGQSALPPPG